jgi:hypothetical protein
MALYLSIRAGKVACNYLIPMTTSHSTGISLYMLRKSAGIKRQKLSFASVRGRLRSKKCLWGQDRLPLASFLLGFLQKRSLANKPPLQEPKENMRTLRRSSSFR